MRVLDVVRDPDETSLTIATVPASSTAPELRRDGAAVRRAGAGEVEVEGGC